MNNSGLKFALLTACVSGFSIFANKIFVTQADPLVFTAVRNVFVALGLLCIALVSKRKLLVPFHSRKQILTLLFIGFFGGGVAFALFFSGLARLSAVEGNLIQKTLFLWVIAFSWIFLKEKSTKFSLFGYVFVTLGTLVIGGVFPKINSAVLMVLSATLIWALESIAVKKMLSTIHPETLAFLRIALGIPVLFLLVFMEGKSGSVFTSKTFQVWPIITSSLFLIAYMTSWYQALKRIPVIAGTAVLAIAPFITTLLANIFISHSVNSFPLLNLVVILTGIVFVIKAYRRNEKV